MLLLIKMVEIVTSQEIKELFHEFNISIEQIDSLNDNFEKLLDSDIDSDIDSDRDKKLLGTLKKKGFHGIIY